jgi:DNA-binding transcriptional ArsR family regulator
MASRSTATNREDAAKREDAMEQHAVKPKLKPEPVSRAQRMNEDGGLDRLIYERVRLGIMSALATNDELTFNELKALFDVSDGNLGAHARKLEEAGYVACAKSFEARRPKSRYRITQVGRKALLKYLEHIEAVIKATRRN